jgi:hypothetical protein
MELNPHEIDWLQAVSDDDVYRHPPFGPLKLFLATDDSSG